jgi:hypothetical protein
MNYELKILKYKQKYLNLKNNMKGGLYTNITLIIKEDGSIQFSLPPNLSTSPGTYIFEHKPELESDLEREEKLEMRAKTNIDEYLEILTHFNKGGSGGRLRKHRHIELMNLIRVGDIQEIYSSILKWILLPNDSKIVSKINNCIKYLECIKLISNLSSSHLPSIIKDFNLIITENNVQNVLDDPMIEKLIKIYISHYYQIIIIISLLKNALL